jgi:hypothetical protein
MSMKKKTKLFVTPKVIFDEIYYEEYVSHVLKDDFRIDGIEINVFVLYIKVAKQISNLFLTLRLVLLLGKLSRIDMMFFLFLKMSM